MEAGDVVVIPFPYTDLSSRKLRPALVLSPAWYNEAHEDALFAYVTSVPQGGPLALPLTNDELVKGSLARPSWVRADKLFTVEQSLVRRAIARLAPQQLARVQEIVCAWVRGVQV